MEAAASMDCILRSRVDTKTFLDCRIVYSQRKTFKLEVFPDMSVRMLAPFGAKLGVCSRMLLKRSDWVQAQLKYHSQFHPLTKPQEYVSGQEHLFMGRRLRLKVISGPAKGVKATRQHLTVCVGRTTSARLVEATLWQWYREQAADLFQERLLGCMVKLGIDQIDGPKELVIRRYKSRWGSMGPTGVLGLNLDLIRAPVECIDHVIVHELCQLRFPHHGPRFWDLLERVMPDWRNRKAKLERLTA
jgi:predicted metal-dependent hydrolase